MCDVRGFCKLRKHAALKINQVIPDGEAKIEGKRIIKALHLIHGLDQDLLQPAVTDHRNITLKLVSD